MTRKKRVWYEGACYHIMGRGNRRGSIFKEPDDYALFLRVMKEVREKCPFILHAFCLMTNHFHLELTTKGQPIWKIMQPLMNSYARIFNGKYGYVGHLFESRYTSCLIENDIYFLEVSRYIHLNPVKASMVREPLAYEYSSYRKYVSAGDSSKMFLDTDLLDTSRVLGSFRHNSREQYRMFVEGKISHAEQEMLIRKDINEDERWLPWEK